MTINLANFATATTGLTYTWDPVLESVGLVIVCEGGYIRKVENQDKIRLHNSRLLGFASKNQPPQSWYDEDTNGLY